MNELIKVGAKVRRAHWKEEQYCEVIYVGDVKFFAKNKNLFDKRHDEDSWLIDADWLPYEEPKKKVMMYPALYKDEHYFWICGYLFSNEKDATKYNPGFFKLLTDRGIEVEV